MMHHFLLPTWSLLLVLLVTHPVVFAEDQKPQEELPTAETWWKKLELDEPEASRALLKLSQDPIAATAIFRANLKPLKLDGDRLKDMIVKLSSDEEKVWKAAFEELEYFDPRLALDLSTLMDVVQVAPVRQRLTEILSGRPAGSLAEKEITLRKAGDDGFNFFDGRGSWWAEHKIERLKGQGWGNPKKKWQRALRATALLEQIGTPEAIAILEDLASGHPEAQPTLYAQECLQRLQSSSAPKPKTPAS